MIKENFEGEESLIIQKKFLKFITEFPDLKWQIRKVKGEMSNQKTFDIRVRGEKKVDGETFLFESNFRYLFSTVDEKINNGRIKNLLTTIRNDENKLDITFKIPEKVLSGAKYDIDIILNEPLGDTIIAGGIKYHQEESYIQQELDIKPLASGGIFKTTRAPSKPGEQIWSGIIAHPKGMVSFTKSVEIVD